MEVERCPLLEVEATVGSEDAVVVVDALRASATVATLLDCGATGVRPVADGHAADEAITAGEHLGERIEGFDFGNSPLEIRDRQEVVTGRDIAVQTTNGIDCVNRVDHAAHVLMGSPINEGPLVEAAVDQLAADTRVYVVPARRRAEYAPEDDYAATRIERRFAAELGRELPALAFDGSPEEVFLESDTGEFLVETGSRDDVVYCAKPNVCDAVPILRDGRFVDATRTTETTQP